MVVGPCLGKIESLHNMWTEFGQSRLTCVVSLGVYLIGSGVWQCMYTVVLQEEIFK